MQEVFDSSVHREWQQHTISRIFNGLCPNSMLNSKYSTPSFSTLCEPEGPPSEILLHEIVHRRHHEYLARGELRLARF